MSAFLSVFVLSALVIFHVQGAMMGDQSSDNGRAGPSIQKHKAEEDSKELASQAPVPSSLKSIADAAHAVSSNAASSGIDAVGCGSSPATMLKAVAAKAKQMAAPKVACVKEEEEEEKEKPPETKNCSTISPERKNAQEAGKEALSLAEAAAKASDEANVATAKSEAAKKKVDAMKNIVSKAYEDAATEAADVAKAKISHVAALETIQAPPAKKSKVAECEKKEKAALKELSDIPTPKQGCDCSAKELNDINDEEKLLDNQIEANLAQASVN